MTLSQYLGYLRRRAPQRRPPELKESGGQEVERKFLLSSIPASVLETPGTPILQGYLALDEAREIRIRRAGKKCLLTIKEWSGLARKELEITLTRQQFDELWPATEGRRLEKTRYTLPHQGLQLELDAFGGDLASFCLGEVEFPSVAASNAFKKPPFFGEEVTERGEYRNANLALHGLPHSQRHEYQIGVLPYLIQNGKLSIVIITNSSQTRWIVPKGQPEPGMSRLDVGLMEAVEEAGIIGTFSSGHRAQCKVKGGRTLYLYPLKVSTLLKTWPEASFRKREVLPLEKAVERIEDQGLARCVLRLASKLLP